MYIKWIVCEVKPKREKEFSILQEQWIAIQNSKGFIGQVGGFDNNHKRNACIISFWDNEASLRLFLEDKHDQIFNSINQSKTYNTIQVDYFNFEINSNESFDLLAVALKNAKILYVAELDIKSNKIDKVREELPVTYLQNALGMLGGSISIDTNNSSHCLVSTFWDSLENYTKYIKSKRFKPHLGLDDYITIIKPIERQIELKESWSVINNQTSK